MVIFYEKTLFKKKNTYSTLALKGSHQMMFAINSDFYIPKRLWIFKNKCMLMSSTMVIMKMNVVVDNYDDADDVWCRRE